MTVELERRDHFYRNHTKEVLRPGTELIKESSRIGEDIRFNILSDDTIEVIKERPGIQISSPEITTELLVEEEINKSRDTFNLYPLAKISWRPTQNTVANS